ncbi:hypothetical protein BDN70DRAFT_881301 [Pholiota conissans]|uniref:F-box domain-containing protein n=1 Tax=Pholiota conissans TaxID=109636 RepID=A0A9P5YX01_9AGAR|nr:hypothetical protein BDN70DRAFT_881301 [Pholiota conissans]
MALEDKARRTKGPVKKKKKLSAKAYRAKLALAERRTAQNALAPISSLPVEIFSLIFSWVRDADSDDFMQNEEGYSVPAPVTWIKVTHVCRLWRRIALDSPILWSRPTFRNVAWAAEMIRRSNQVGLSIEGTLHHNWDVETSEEYDDSYLRAFQNYRMRMRHFSLRSDAWAWHHLKKFRKQAPELESLCLSSSYVPPIHLTGSDDWERPFFKKGTMGYALATGTAKLRSLELNYFQIQWDIDELFLATLTRLKLHGSVPTTEVNWQWFVDMLKGMPGLEILDLKDTFPVCSLEEAERTSGHAHLERLRELSVSCEPQEMEMFLSHITFPATTQVRIECCTHPTIFYSVESRLDFSGAFKALAQIYSLMALPPKFQTLIMQPPPLNLPGARIKLFQHAMDDEQMLYAYSDNVYAQLEITYTWPSRYEVLEAIAAKAARNLFRSRIPLQDIKHVYLQDEIDGLGALDLAETLGELLPRASHFLMNEKTSRVLVNTISCRRSRGSSPESSKPYFPLLRSIVFLGTIFEKGFHLQGWPHLSLDELCSFLRQRRSEGSGLTHVSFIYCYSLNSTDVRRVRGLVYNVRWDGQLLEFDSEDHTEVDDEVYDLEEGEYWEASSDSDSDSC